MQIFFSTLMVVMVLLMPCSFAAPGAAVPELIGVRFNAGNVFEAEFIFDDADGRVSAERLKEEGARVAEYFLAALTVDDDDFWVNLAPGEAGRVMPDSLSRTSLGALLLQEDYYLKQFSSNLTNPDSPQGKAYWASLGSRGISNGSVSKIWISPDQARVYEDGGSAFIAAATMRTAIEGEHPEFEKYIMPLLVKEVNHGQGFSALRTAYRTLILASWFKQKLRHSAWNAAYLGRGKIDGILYPDTQIRRKIYSSYLLSLNNGVYSLKRRESGVLGRGKILLRHYFSGGVTVQRADGYNLMKAGPVIEQRAVTSKGRRVKVIFKPLVRNALGMALIYKVLGCSVHLGMVNMSAGDLDRERNIVQPGIIAELTPRAPEEDIRDDDIGDEEKKEPEIVSGAISDAEKELFETVDLSGYKVLIARTDKKTVIDETLRPGQPVSKDEAIKHMFHVMVVLGDNRQMVEWLDNITQEVINGMTKNNFVLLVHTPNDILTANVRDEFTTEISNLRAAGVSIPNARLIARKILMLKYSDKPEALLVLMNDEKGSADVSFVSTGMSSDKAYAQKAIDNWLLKNKELRQVLCDDNKKSIDSLIRMILENVAGLIQMDFSSSAGQSGRDDSVTLKDVLKLFKTVDKNAGEVLAEGGQDPSVSFREIIPLLRFHAREVIKYEKALQGLMKMRALVERSSLVDGVATWEFDALMDEFFQDTDDESLSFYREFIKQNRIKDRLDFLRDMVVVTDIVPKAILGKVKLSPRDKDRLAAILTNMEKEPLNSEVVLAVRNILSFVIPDSFNTAHNEEEIMYQVFSAYSKKVRTMIFSSDPKDTKDILQKVRDKVRFFRRECGYTLTMAQAKNIGGIDMTARAITSAWKSPVSEGELTADSEQAVADALLGFSYSIGSLQ